MDYDITIVCSANDFYLGDALCREVERQGKRCLFNWRDAKKPLKPGAAFVRKSPTFVLVFNQDSLCNSDFKIITKMQSGMSDVTVVLLCQDMFEQVPADWKSVTKLDVEYGLTPQVLDYFGLARNVNTHHVSPASSPTSAAPPKKQQAPSIQEVVEVEDKATAKITQQLEDDAVSVPEIELSSQTSLPNVDRVENTNSDLSQSKPNQTNPQIPQAEDWRTRARREIAKLRTVMTSAPTKIEEKWPMSRKDLVGEAYLVPLYMLRFERADCIPQLIDLFKNLPDMGMNVQRSLRYLSGDGVPKDKSRSLSLMQRAVRENENDAVAQYCLGIFYEFGIGITNDSSKAEECYSKACSLGLSAAKTRLASVFLKVGKDIENAMNLLHEAQKSGENEASFMLGVIAEDNGNLEDAFEYYSEAAEMGHAKGQNALAAMYYNGIYVQQDINTALQWCNMSAKQGFAGAIYNQVANNINNIDKARPSGEAIREGLEPFKEVGIDSVTNLPTYSAAMYNIGILCRRCDVPMKSVSTWMDRARDLVPYVDEFYRHYKAEESRMKVKGAGISIVNGIGKLMYGSEWEDVNGGLFDSSMKKW